MSEDSSHESHDLHESHPSHNTNMVRNIITGVITTVVGATFVYFLNRSSHNSNDSSQQHGSYLEVKDATINTWNDYVKLENLEYENTTLLSKNLKSVDGLDDFKSQIENESQKFVRDIQDKLKNTNIDDNLVSLLKRRLDAESESLKLFNSFFDECKNIINTTTIGEDRTAKVNAALTKFQSSGEVIQQRSKNEIKDIAESLNKKYGQSFITDSLTLFKESNNPAQTNNNNNNNPNGNQVNNNNDNNRTNVTTTETVVDGRNLVGEWDTPGAVITLSSNGQLTWETTNGQATNGTWQFYNNQLYMMYANNYGTSVTSVFNLSNVTANSFTMQLTVYPYNRYDLRRYRGN